MKNGIVVVGVLLAVCLLSGLNARAEEHDQLIPLLVDLEGWSAPPPQGMSLGGAGLKMISAFRRFHRGDAVLSVSLAVNSGPGAADDLKESTRENDTNRTITRQVDGFWVTSTQSKLKKTGQIMVYLAHNRINSSLLTCDYQQMTEDEALAVLQGFDWGKMKTVVAPML